MLLFTLSALAADTLVFHDELPTTLNPLYASTGADFRAQEMLFDRLFFMGPIG